MDEIHDLGLLHVAMGNGRDNHETERAVLVIEAGDGAVRVGHAIPLRDGPLLVGGKGWAVLDVIADTIGP